jgi:hypothetical protein
MRFPYQRYQVTTTPTLPTAVLYRPEVPLRVLGPGGDASVLALVDTGADHTLLPRTIGDAIGAVIDDTRRWPVGGIAGQEIELAPGDIDLELMGGGQTFQWQATVGFATFTEPEDEVIVLGHTGFLDFFRVLFDGHLRELEVLPAPNFPGTVS